MDTEISKLRRLNLIAGLLHLASLIGIIALSNDAAMPVRATYLTDAPTLDAFSDPVQLFNLNISWMIGAFLALSAFFHFLIISPKFFPRYSAGLAARHNYFRWVEYSISSSLMIVVILQLNGVADYIALGIVPWIMIAINTLSPKGPAETVVPGFVYGIVISLFLLFNSFALVQWKQYKAKGKWANYLYGERAYIVLSLIAKSALAWQIFSGALAV